VSILEYLRVIPRRCNGHKGNRVCLHQHELFHVEPEPHQLALL